MAFFRKDQSVRADWGAKFMCGKTFNVAIVVQTDTHTL